MLPPFPPSVDPPGFLCRQPCQLSKLVNLLCRSIFFRPPLFLSSSSHLLLCYRGNQPDRKHGQSKKAPVGHDLQTRAVPRRREEAGHRAEHTKHPLYNSGRSAAPRHSADNGARGEIGLPLCLMSCKRLRPRRNGLVKMSRESKGGGGEGGGVERGGRTC